MNNEKILKQKKEFSICPVSRRHEISLKFFSGERDGDKRGQTYKEFAFCLNCGFKYE